MQYLFPEFTYGPVLTVLLLTSIIGALAHALVFKTSRFDSLIKAPLAAAYVTVPATALIFIAGFLASFVWQNSQQARAALSEERLALSRLHHALVESQELQSGIRKGVEAYVSLVREKEWAENYNTQPSPEVERALNDLKGLLRASQTSAHGTAAAANLAARDLLRDLESLEKAREKRLELGGFSRFGYLDKWVILYLMLLVSAINVAAVHRIDPRTAGIALCVYCTAMALMFSVIALSIHPYKGPGALTAASLVVK